MKKKLIILVASLAILVANLAILPISAATEDVSPITINSVSSNIYVDTNYTLEETLEIIETLNYTEQSIADLETNETITIKVYLILNMQANTGGQELKSSLLFINVSDIQYYLMSMNYVDNVLQDPEYLWGNEDNMNWIPFAASSIFEETENTGIYKIKFAEEWQLINDSVDVEFFGLTFTLTPYTQNEKLIQIFYDITPPAPTPPPPTIFELIYSFIYDTILGGESNLFDTSQLAVLLTLFVIILIILAILSIIRGVFNWFRWRR